MSTHELDLAELELERGVDVARWIDHLRAQRNTHGRLRVRNCPQMLAHTLYKAGLLRDGGRMQLTTPRNEVGRSN